jgi:hypothetical protein
MHYETRTLYVAFWDRNLGGGFYGILVGWNEYIGGRKPVVAHDGGLREIHGDWHLYAFERDAGEAVANMRDPEASDADD